MAAEAFATCNGFDADFPLQGLEQELLGQKVPVNLFYNQPDGLGCGDQSKVYHGKALAD